MATEVKPGTVATVGALQGSSLLRRPPAGAPDSQGAFSGFLDSKGNPIRFTRTLKNFTGQNVLTGGTINTKTLLMQVPLPDGCLLDYRAGIRVSAIFGFTMNTNSKACGVDIGTSFGTASNMWGRTRASATSGAESILIDFQRSPLDSTKLLLAYGQAAPYEGAPNNNISTYTLHHSINPASTGLSLYFWGNLITANTDQVTLARAKVELAVAEN